MATAIYVLSIVEMVGGGGARVFLRLLDVPPPASPAMEMLLPGRGAPHKIRRMIQDGTTGDSTILLEQEPTMGEAEKVKQNYLDAGWHELSYQEGPGESRGEVSAIEYGNITYLFS